MKVYEIISKNRVDEGLGVGPALVRGVRGVKKGIGKAVDFFTPTAKEMALVNVNTKGMLANITALLPGIIMTSTMVEPIRKYNEQISNFQKAVDLGNRTQADFDKYREQRATVLVETLAMEIGGYIVSKIGFSGIRLILNKTPGLKAAAAKVSAIGPEGSRIPGNPNFGKTLGNAAGAVATGGATVATAYFMNSLNNDEARKQLTTLVLGDSTMLGQLFVNAVDFLDKKIDSAIAYVKGGGQPTENKPTENKPTTTPEPIKPNLSPEGLPWSNSYWTGR